MSESAKKSPVVFIYLALTLSTLLVFWQVRNFDFVNYDDNEYVYENPHVLNGLASDSIVWAFTTGHAANWHPLTWLSLMLDCQLFGSNPGRIHLVNVFLHLANTLLLFVILKKMTGSLWPSAFVAAAFALHPMHIQSVAWISERKDVLSTFFWMLTLFAYVGYVKRPGLPGYLLTVAAFALGLMAKPMLVTLPFVLLLLDYWPLNRFEPRMIKSSGRKISKLTPTPDRRAVLQRIIIEKIPFLTLAAVSSMVTFLVQQGGGSVIDVNSLPLKSRVANAFLSYIRYVGKMFWPQNLAVFYPGDVRDLTFWRIVLCVLLLLVISVFVIRFGRKQKYLPVGWFWFVGMLIPVIGFVQVGEQSLADRYTYIPYIGLFIMIAWGLPELFSKWPHRKIVLGISMLTVLTALAIQAYRQVGYWKNSEALFSHAVAVTQNNYVAYNCLGEEYRKQGKTALAVEYCAKSLQIVPEYVHAVLAFGCALGAQGDDEQAIKYFQKTLQLTPDSAIAHYNLGISLRKQGKFAEAFTHFAQAVQLKPDLPEARSNLAKGLIQQGRLDEALDQFRAAIRLSPDWFVPMDDLAWCIATHPEIKNRDVNEAVRVAGRACSITNDSNPAVLGILAAAYASAGRFTEAIDTSKTAINLADAVNQPQLKNMLQYHLSFYTQGKPYIEPPQNPEPNKP